MIRSRQAVNDTCRCLVTDCWSSSSTDWADIKGEKGRSQISFRLGETRRRLSHQPICSLIRKRNNPSINADMHMCDPVQPVSATVHFFSLTCTWNCVCGSGFWSAGYLWVKARMEASMLVAWIKPENAVLSNQRLQKVNLRGMVNALLQISVLNWTVALWCDEELLGSVGSSKLRMLGCNFFYYPFELIP